MKQSRPPIYLDPVSLVDHELFGYPMILFGEPVKHILGGQLVLVFEVVKMCLNQELVECQVFYVLVEKVLNHREPLAVDDAKCFYVFSHFII